MQLTPLAHDNMNAALRVIERGLAAPAHASWADTLKRLARLQGTELTGPIGYLLRKGDDDVGVLLTLRSRRQGLEGGGQDVVNLSSWYVDEAHRWYAPMMLKRVLRDNDAVFTDLTASDSVQAMLPSLKFEQWTDGVFLTSLPQSIMQYRRGVSIVPFQRLKPGQVGDSDMKLLGDHHAAGCLCCVLFDGDEVHPLIFMTRYRRRIPHAYLIYARDRKAVLRAAGNVCAYLLGRGRFLLALDCNADECPPGGSFRKSNWHKYVNGSIDKGAIDYAYSELVYLGCD